MALLIATRRTAASSAFLTRLLSRSLNPNGAASSVAQLSSRSVRYNSDGDSDDEYLLGPKDCIIIAEGGTYGTRSNKINIKHGFCDSYMQNPFQTGGPKGAYEVKQVEDGLFLRMEIPGIDKEDVKIWVEGNDTLYVKGEGKKGSIYEERGRDYNAKIKVPAHIDVEIEDMDAEIKNGVLEILFPKCKPYQGNFSDDKLENQN